MKCNRCGQNEASIHIVNIENGVASESYLCAACSAQAGMMLGQLSLKDLFTAFILPQPEEKACGQCGTTIADIKNTGFVGCERCYADLREELLPMLKALHGSAAHVGGIEQNGAQPDGQKELSCLRSRLSSAIAEERYEEAAQLRDRIRVLEGAKVRDGNE